MPWSDHESLLRATDFALVVCLAYALVPTLVPSMFGPGSIPFSYFVHALGWRLFHSFGLGLVLQAQSESKWLVRHYLKHYHYRDGEAGAIEETFGNWKVIYNLSLCMTYGELPCASDLTCDRLLTAVRSSVSFFGLAWKMYSIPSDWTVGGQLLRHTLGVVRCSPASGSLRPL